MALKTQDSEISTAPTLPLPANTPSRLRLVLFRSIAIACPVILILALWVMQADQITDPVLSTALFVFFHATFILLLVALINLKPPPATPADMQLVTFRSIAIACALMPILALWVVQSELIWYSGHSTAVSLFFHVVFVILVVGLINLGIQKKWPHVALSPIELLTIYTMLSIAGTFCSHDLLQVLVPSLAFPEYAANPQNRWEEILLPHVAPWAIVTDKDAAHALAVGNSSFYQVRMLLAWLRPLAFWFTFLMALVGALLCINIFFRRQWTEKERLTFPIIQIPILISTQLGSLLRN